MKGWCIVANSQKQALGFTKCEFTCGGKHLQNKMFKEEVVEHTWIVEGQEST